MRDELGVWARVLCVSTTSESVLLTSHPALKDSRGANFSYSSVSIKLSLLVSQIQRRSVPERRGSSRTPEVSTGLRTGTRCRTDGCGRPSSGHLRGHCQTLPGGRASHEELAPLLHERGRSTGAHIRRGATRRPNQNTTPFSQSHYSWGKNIYMRKNAFKHE